MRNVMPFRALLPAALTAVLLAAATATAYWPASGGGPQDDAGRAVAVGPGGEVYVAGTFQGVATFGQAEVRSEGLSDVFVAKYNPAGTLEWVASAGGIHDDQALGVAVDEAGHAFVVGIVRGDVRFGGVAVSGNLDGENDGFVARIDPDGTWRWVILATGAGDDRAVAVDWIPGDSSTVPATPGSLVVAGSYQCDVTAGSETLNQGACPSATRDSFVARLDADGTVHWLVDGGSGSLGSDWLVDLSAAPDRTVYVAGMTAGPTDFAGTFLRSGRTWMNFSEMSGGLNSWYHTFWFSGAGQAWIMPWNLLDADESLYLYREVALPAGSQPRLRFEHGRESHDPVEPARGVLEVSVDGGPYQDMEAAGGVFLAGGYDELLASPGHPLDGRRVWTYPVGGTTLGVEVDLSAFAGHGISLRWRVATTSTPGDVWWAVDRVEIWDTTTGESFFRADMEDHPRGFVAALTNVMTDTPFWQWVRETSLNLDVHSVSADAGAPVVLGRGVDAGDGWGLSRVQLFPAGDFSPEGSLVGQLHPSGSQWNWARQLLGAVPGDVAVDGPGNVYLTGAFSGTQTYGSETLTAQGPADVLVAAFDPAGAWRWATGGDAYDPADGVPGKGGGPGDDRGLGIAVGSGSVLVAGSFQDTATFGQDEQLTSAGGGDVLAAELSPDGRWFEVQHWIVGQEVPPPAGAYVGTTAAAPELLVGGQAAALGDFFYWSPPLPGRPEGKLYALQPVEDAELRWRVSSDLSDSDRVISMGNSVWPAERCLPSSSDPCYQVHVVGAPVELIPDDGHLAYLGLELPDSGSSGATVDGTDTVFSASSTGWAVVEYVDGPAPDPTRYPVVFEVVRSFEPADAPDFADQVPWPIGTEITDAFHDEPGRTGFVLSATAFFDGTGADAAYNRQTRTGQIIPVNRVNPNRSADSGKDMTVVWYRRNHNRVYWAERPVRYDCRWPLDPDVIIIASEEGGEVRGQRPLDPAAYPGARIYAQPDPGRPGFNPNDEHALMLPSNTGSGVDAVFALRADFGTPINPFSSDASDPYVLIKYEAAGGGWAYRVYKVLATSPEYQGFSFTGVAGDRVQPPYPLSILPPCAETRVQGQRGDRVPPPFFMDVHDELWAAAEGQGSVLYSYPMQPGFFYDTNGDDQPDAAAGECIPWMARLPESMGGTPSPSDPIEVSYDISWPADVPLLEVGETLLKPKRGLPDIYDQAAVEVVYDQRHEEAVAADDHDPAEILAQIIDPLDPRSVDLAELPADLATELDDQGRTKILGSADGTVRLPVTLRKRLRYDSLNGRLSLSGLYDDSGAGEPLLLLNVMSNRERDQLLAASGDGDWQDAVMELYRHSRNPHGIQGICTAFDQDGACTLSRSVRDSDVLIGWTDEDGDTVLEPYRGVGIHPALTAGAAQGEGYLTLAFNNDPSLGSLPVSLSVIRVGCLVYPEPPADPQINAPYMGEVKVLPPDNVFDESLTLHFSGDFGGRADSIEFSWYYHPDEDGTPPPPPDPEHGQMNGWIEVSLADPVGANDITIGGADLQTLSDNWYLVRYRGLPACNNQTTWSLWAGQPGATPTDPRAQLAEGWVKRVLEGLNPFEARVRDFHRTATNTFASMIEQLGPRYEGDIALNPSADNLNSIGLIEAYETVLHRARMLSIDGTPPVDYGPANNAILDVTTKIAQFYGLLGNEAYADAVDPTVGITTDEVQFNIGALAPSIFNFENQVPDLLGEELVLLRGRDDSQAPVAAPPVYNRFFWNFTGGNGEVAYALSYDIQDKNLDGFIDATDAKIMFPQGHGDAWGHYLTALTHYYDLLRHPFFTWVPRAEAVLVAGVPIQVDYFDERTFARIAAAKALAGADIVEETVRSFYTEDPSEQWKGYKDDDPQRAWGVDGWARRAGMGAYFDWVTGNAILPAEDTNPDHHGISRVDRTTVEELDEIVAHYEKIQAEVDAADGGLNPLGVAKNAVPFDIDPAQVDAGKGHFEQVLDRARQALASAVTVWDYANELNRMLRFNQDDVQKMRVNAHSTEVDFKNQLIEIFGYPYADDIGPGGTYPADYDGPDLYHYMYVDAPELSGTGFDVDGNLPGEVQRFTARFKPITSGIGFINITGDEPEGIEELCEDHPTDNGCTLGDLPDSELEVEYVTWRSPDGHFAFTKPPEWTGERRAQGKIQEALAAILNARVALEKAITEYDALRGDVQNQLALIRATYNIRRDQIDVANSDRRTLKKMTTAVQTMEWLSKIAEGAAKVVDTSFEIGSDCLPKEEIFGLSDGGDLLSTVRCLMKGTGKGLALDLEGGAGLLERIAKTVEASKENVELQGAIYTRIDDARIELYGLKDRFDALMRREPVLAAEVFARAQQLEQARQSYLKALAEGQRLLGQLTTFRKNTAAAVQEYRYQDMAFRIFRNDALQKYRAAFDMAARYTYLAATAYDYDTNLLGTDGKAGQRFLTDIVKQRSLGQILDGEPVPGTPGLADPLGKLELDWAVLEGQMGFNNPQIETDRISLRHELLRLKDDDEGAAGWRRALEGYRVDDLWQVPEFRRFMRPFAPESQGPQPGLVIPFSSTVTFGLNFFGKPLGPGDHAFDPSRFATRVRGVGVLLEGYENLPLSATPRVYLVPVGNDVLRAPTVSTDTFPVRDWFVLDQILPVPYPVNTSDLAQEGWTPLADMLSGSFGRIRRISSFRAYPDTGTVDDSQLALDSRLISRSVWNSRWLLVIPGGTLLADPVDGIDTLIEGPADPNTGERPGNGISDIELVFKTYSYEGLK